MPYVGHTAWLPPWRQMVVSSESSGNKLECNLIDKRVLCMPTSHFQSGFRLLFEGLAYQLKSGEVFCAVEDLVVVRDSLQSSLY
jgi:hypothetical protein